MTTERAAGIESNDALEQLRRAISEHPIGPFLLTVTGECRPHLGDVEARWHGEELLVAAPNSWPGSQECGHVTVTLFWPPRAPGGYSLIVDGTARATTGVIAIAPTRAVHYRPRRDASRGGEPCGADCLPIFSR